MVHRRALLAGLAGLPGCAQAQDAPHRRFDQGIPSRPFLRPLGALELNTATWGFGGLSALHLGPDLTLTAISDRGFWWEAPLRLEAEALTGLGPVRHGPLRDRAGQPMRYGDAEALLRLPDGAWLVGYERQHRILRHARLDGPGLPYPAPPGLEASPSNGGLEALALLADGRILAISESLPAGPGRAAWLGRGSPTRWTPTSYRPAHGLEPTDATALPDGGALVLERSFGLFTGFRCRLAYLSPAALARPVMEAETWLDLPGDGPAENWEGVAATAHEKGALVAIVSDDNQSPFQKTLLLLYRLGG